MVDDMAWPDVYPNFANTLSVAQGVVDFITIKVAPLQINGNNALTFVALGGIKPTSISTSVPFATVTLATAPSKRIANGGKMKNELHFNVEAYADYTHSQQAEEYIAQIYDLLTALFQSHARLGETVPGISYVGLNDQVPTFGFITQNVPIPLRMVRIGVTVHQMYNLSITL